MDVSGRACNSSIQTEEYVELRRGPWTMEEDVVLANYIADHGEGRWNSLARCAGLKRTGKSCRLRWLNYLRPDVRRGNITPEEQLLILELHSRWGNRWSKIAQHLPGRTDNEIKNYWRTRVQKHAKQLQCDVNSKQFKDTMRYIWMPRLVERIRAAAGSNNNNNNSSDLYKNTQNSNPLISITNTGVDVSPPINFPAKHMPEISASASSDSIGTQLSTISNLTDYYFPAFQAGQVGYPDLQTTSDGYVNDGSNFFPSEQSSWVNGSGDISDDLWSMEDIWFLQQQQVCNSI